MEEVLEELKRSSYFISLDLFYGYWQVPLNESVKDITKFSCRLGACKFEVMAPGLINAPWTFQRTMNQILGDIPSIRKYLDDEVVFTKLLEVQTKHAQIVLKKISVVEVKLKIKKRSFAKKV